MRIADYPKKETLRGGEYFAVDDVTEGTKAASMDVVKNSFIEKFGLDDYYRLLDNVINSWKIRRNIYRGKKIGDAFTDEQKERIADGSFKDMFIGDYWLGTDSLTRWTIADFDYWFQTGDTQPTKHHLVIVPDRAIGPAKKMMNASGITPAGYIGTDLRKTGLQEAHQIVYDYFGFSFVLNHREILTNAIANHVAAGVAWADSRVEVMNEPMVYGAYHLGLAFTQGDHTMMVNTVDKSQLSLFRLDAQAIECMNQAGTQLVSYWLRDVVSGQGFTSVHSRGHSTFDNVINELTIRPCFGIIGN